MTRLEEIKMAAASSYPDDLLLQKVFIDAANWADASLIGHVFEQKVKELQDAIKKTGLFVIDE